MTVSMSSDVTVYTGGAATAMSNEATTDLGAHTVYQITNSAKRIFDPDTAIVVATQTGGEGEFVVDTATTYSVDAFFGKITFSEAKGATDVVRINSASYIPRLAVLKAKSADATFSRAALDITSLGDTAPAKIAGQFDCSCTIDTVEPLFTDLDSGGGTRKLSTDILGGTTLLVELTIGAEVWMAWMHPSDAKLSLPATGLSGATIGLVGQQRQLTGRSERICWSHS